MLTRVLIVDDEPLARERMQAMLAELMVDFMHEVVGEASDGEQALAMSLQLRPDIILLDIRMPRMDGLQVAHHLSHLPDPPAVIFATAYDEHALAAFEAHAVGYLVKPVRKQKLLDALQHASRVSKQQAREIVSTGNSSNGKRDKFCVSKRGELVMIPMQNIYYFMADQKYVTLYHRKNNQWKEEIIDETLKELEDEFEVDFLRIHRNALVAKQYIEKLVRDDKGHYHLKLTDVTEPLDVSRRKVKEVKAILKAR